VASFDLALFCVYWMNWLKFCNDFAIMTEHFLDIIIITITIIIIVLLSLLLFTLCQRHSFYKLAVSRTSCKFGCQYECNRLPGETSLQNHCHIVIIISHKTPVLDKSTTQQEIAINDLLYVWTETLYSSQSVSLILHCRSEL